MTALATTSVAAASDGKIVCQIDGARCHAIVTHLKNNHPDWTIERYLEAYPDAPTLSDVAKAQIAARAAQKAAAAGTQPLALQSGVVKKPFHEVFGLGNAKAAKRASGEPMLIDTFASQDPATSALVPKIDENYVFSIEDTKDVIIGLALSYPIYVWGYHGTGKTTLLEQVHARTKRPFLRVQHNIGTEEADIVGQWTVRGGDTIFQPGPLTMAMIEGWTYCADEYDFAMPAVTAVYQAVLEGKALVIKNAPAELRVVEPHANFRFCATGNTCGIGDETGLYQGTQMGNAANYSRFGMTIQIDYMAAKIETIVIANQSSCSQEDAAKFVTFANEVRNAYKAGKIGSTISPRELINAATLGLARANWRAGLARAYLNRCSRVDREVIDAYAQRIFG